jgi:predicted nucleotidyltransferase
MKTFDSAVKDLKDHLNESILNINRNTLDPTVFEMTEVPGQQPKLMDPIKGEIMKKAKLIDKIVPIKSVYIIGSILTNKYDPNSDIDVTIEVDPTDLDSLDASIIMKYIKTLNTEYANGTTHKINYYIIKGDFDFSKSDAIYDVPNDKWLKIPKSNDIDVQMHLSRFENDLEEIAQSTEEIRRDLIDLEEIKSLTPRQINNLKDMVQEKLDNLNHDIETLVTLHKTFKNIRKTAFDQYLTPNQIREIGSKNKLPENIIYKLVERYYYWDFIKKLEDIIENKKVGMNDLNKLKNIGKELWK